MDGGVSRRQKFRGVEGKRGRFVEPEGYLETLQSTPDQTLISDNNARLLPSAPVARHP